MERDVRRDRGHWRGCHTFEDIVCDDDSVGSQKRNGGLKMGQAYYYYYEIDGSTETYDPSLPTTTACPYMPGQTVNMLEVPIEQPSRTRRASMTSIHETDFRTMNPSDKFSSPRAAPSVPLARVGSSPSLNHKPSARSLSPTPSWKGTARRIFGLKRSSRDKKCRISGEEIPPASTSYLDPARSATPESNRSRAFSPDDLRRFLSDDDPVSTRAFDVPPKLWIPDDMVEETDDDDNFATSAVSERSASLPFTLLSPPPFPRSFSSASMTAGKKEFSATIVPRTSSQDTEVSSPIMIPASMMDLKIDIPQSHFSFSTTSSVTSPTSPRSVSSHDISNYSFFDDSNDDDEDDDEDYFIHEQVESDEKHDKSNSYQPFTGYSLPHATADSRKYLTPTPSVGHPRASPAFVSRNENGEPTGNTGLLGRPGIDAGLDDLVSEMNWMADVIRPKDI